MIIFADDWNKEENKNAIIDWDTKNETFINYVGVLETMGVKNRFWPLALHNPLLKGVNPFDPNLTDEYKVMIVIESKNNFWYFVREVIRVPSQGSLEGIHFRAHRFNMALYWCYFNHITTLGILPRQQGKTLASGVLWRWVLDVGAQNSIIGLYTKDDQLRGQTVKQLKDIGDELPSYFNIRTRLDTNNTEMITNKALNNSYITAVAQASPKNALKVFRGFSIPNFHGDELAFCVNNRITVPSMLAAGNTARKNAELNGAPYGTIFTTTAGYLNTEHGIYAREVYDESLPWYEVLLDTPDRKTLEDVIRKNNRKRMVELNPKNLDPRPPVQLLLEFNHRQLGVSDEDFLDMIENAKAKGEAIDADFLNKWPKGSDNSPLSPETLETMYDSINYDPYVTVENGYLIKWYISKEEVAANCPGRKLVVGIDPSEAAGGDDIGLVIMDAYSGEVVGVGKYNETNIIKYSMWVGKLLKRFENMILIIERKSLGTTILDSLMLYLPSQGIDPFKRIYTRIVEDMNEIQEFKDFLNTNYRNRNMDFYYKNKKLVGYTTSGEGRHARENIYQRAWNGATSYLPHLIKSNELYDQLSNLIYKNGRIDHKPGMHDDIVFSWLLCYWFLTVSRNKKFYGINPDLILKKIRENLVTRTSTEEIVARQDKIILAKLDSIKTYILNNSNNRGDLTELKFIYNELASKLSNQQTNDVYDFDTLITEIDKENKVKNVVTDYSRLSIRFS